MSDREVELGVRLDRFTTAERAFRPYALAIGQCVIAWNELHEKLGRLFSLVTHGPDRVQALAIWQSSQADRAKRAMLEAAVKEVPLIGIINSPRLIDDVMWILAQCNSLEETRNNIVHGPLHLEVYKLKPKSDFGPISFKEIVAAMDVAPMTLAGNPRAKKLVGKNLLAEFRRFRMRTTDLTNFVSEVDRAVDASPSPWPDRPTQPAFPETTKAQRKRQ